MNLEQQHQSLYNLKIIKELFDKNNIPYWLDAGTLLCCYRDGNLTWEHDTDIGVFVEDFNKIMQLKDQLNTAFDNSFGEFNCCGKNPIFISVGTEKIPHTDLIFWYPIKINLDSKNKDCKNKDNIEETNRKFCWSVLDRFFSLPSYLLNSFTELAFKNLDSSIKFKVPEKTLEYIKYYFGDNWNIPHVDITEINPVNKIYPELILLKNDILNGNVKIEFNQ